MVRKTRGRSLITGITLWVFPHSERREILGVPVVVPTTGAVAMHSQKSQARSISLETTEVAPLTISGATRTAYSFGVRRERSESGIVKRGWWFSRKHTYATKAGRTRYRFNPGSRKHACAVGGERVRVFTGTARANRESMLSPAARFCAKFSEPGDLVGEAERQLQRQPGDFTNEAWLVAVRLLATSRD
jgi:hypothetical protein